MLRRRKLFDAEKGYDEEKRKVVEAIEYAISLWARYVKTRYTRTRLPVFCLSLRMASSNLQSYVPRDPPSQRLRCDDHAMWLARNTAVQTFRVTRYDLRATDLLVLLDVEW